MIDKEIFLQRMALLAGRIGRELEPPVQAEYFRQLNAELTTEQFYAATALAFKTWDAAYRNWPSPAQLVELIAPVPNPTLDAAEAFERVLAIWNDPRISPDDRREKTLALGASTTRAFHAAGGRRELENILEVDVKWARQRFVEAYTASCLHAEEERQTSLALERADATVKALIEKTAEQRAMPAAQKRLGGTPDYSGSRMTA